MMLRAVFAVLLCATCVSGSFLSAFGLGGEAEGIRKEIDEVRLSLEVQEFVRRAAAEKLKETPLPSKIAVDQIKDGLVAVDVWITTALANRSRVKTSMFESTDPRIKLLRRVQKALTETGKSLGTLENVRTQRRTTYLGDNFAARDDINWPLQKEASTYRIQELYLKIAELQRRLAEANAKESKPALPHFSDIGKFCTEQEKLVGLLKEYIALETDTIDKNAGIEPVATLESILAGVKAIESGSSMPSSVGGSIAVPLSISAPPGVPVSTPQNPVMGTAATLMGDLEAAEMQVLEVHRRLANNMSKQGIRYVPTEYEATLNSAVAIKKSIEELEASQGRIPSEDLRLAKVNLETIISLFSEMTETTPTAPARKKAPTPEKMATLKAEADSLVLSLTSARAKVLEVQGRIQAFDATNLRPNSLEKKAIQIRAEINKAQANVTKFANAAEMVKKITANGVVMRIRLLETEMSSGAYQAAEAARAANAARGIVPPLPGSATLAPEGLAAGLLGAGNDPAASALGVASPPGTAMPGLATMGVGPLGAGPLGGTLGTGAPSMGAPSTAALGVGTPGLSGPPLAAPDSAVPSIQPASGLGLSAPSAPMLGTFGAGAPAPLDPNAGSQATLLGAGALGLSGYTPPSPSAGIPPAAGASILPGPAPLASQQASPSAGLDQMAAPATIGMGGSPSEITETLTQPADTLEELSNQVQEAINRINTLQRKIDQQRAAIGQSPVLLRILEALCAAGKGLHQMERTNGQLQMTDPKTSSAMTAKSTQLQGAIESLKGFADAIKRHQSETPTARNPIQVTLAEANITHLKMEQDAAKTMLFAYEQRRLAIESQEASKGRPQSPDDALKAINEVATYLKHFTSIMGDCRDQISVHAAYQQVNDAARLLRSCPDNSMSHAEILKRLATLRSEMSTIKGQMMARSGAAAPESLTKPAQLFKDGNDALIAIEGVVSLKRSRMEAAPPELEASRTSLAQALRDLFELAVPASTGNLPQAASAADAVGIERDLAAKRQEFVDLLRKLPGHKSPEMQEGEIRRMLEEARRRLTIYLASETSADASQALTLILPKLTSASNLMATLTPAYYEDQVPAVAVPPTPRAVAVM